MEALITLARVYLEDSTTTEISDAIILQKLNMSRHYIEDLQIYAEDYSYDNISHVYRVGYANLMNVIVTDGNDAVIADTDYTIDAENGLITFDGSPVVIPDAVFIEFTYHDFLDAVAEMWKYLAARSRFDGAAKLGDEGIPEDRGSRSYCIRKYWDYKQSKNIQITR